MFRAAAIVAATTLLASCTQVAPINESGTPIGGAPASSSEQGGRVATPTIALPADATSATVNHVHDGDTLFLTTPADSNLKVRLTGIDTPEIGDNLECYGDEATALLKELLPDGSQVYTQTDVEPLDQYGRSLLYLFTADGTSINLEMVMRGAAEAVRIRQNDAYWDQLSSAEAIAVESAAGQWGSC